MENMEETKKRKRMWNWPWPWPVPTSLQNCNMGWYKDGILIILSLFSPEESTSNWLGQHRGSRGVRRGGRVQKTCSCWMPRSCSPMDSGDPSEKERLAFLSKYNRATFRTHVPHTEQWCALSGLIVAHFSQYRTLKVKCHHNGDVCVYCYASTVVQLGWHNKFPDCVHISI